jgi:hypothetical protein
MSSHEQLIHITYKTLLQEGYLFVILKTFKGFHVLRENQREILCIVFYLEKKIMLLTFYFYNSFQIQIRGTNMFFFFFFLPINERNEHSTQNQVE